MRKKILVTGGSGFIGTNVIEHLINKGYTILNLDIEKPKLEERNSIWRKIDICKYDELQAEIIKYNPNYIIHLAARTDLNGKSVDDYKSNTIGTENILKSIKELNDLTKIIITSSKFVTPNGYKVKDQFDFKPHTIYGESKVITEKNVWSNKPQCDWCIIRPTSIWGPWFDIPYRDFFNMVMKKRFLHIGKSKCFKTYGYIKNSIYQIEQLLLNETHDENNKVFYIGDEPAYEINEWADEIADEIGYSIITVPSLLIRLAAIFGDLLKIIKIRFPITSFRYHNMTKNGTNDMSKTYKIAPLTISTRKQGIKETLHWMRFVERKD